MPRPVSKPADMYNYRVAAYLKSSDTIRLFDYPTKELEYSVLPPPIPRDSTYLNIELLFDIVISKPPLEILAECKSQQIPKPLNKNSSDVKEAIAEFIAAEKYRMNDYKRDTIYYLLITNSPTTQLIRDIEDLKVANDADVKTYCEKLEDAALKKWVINNPVEIQPTWLRNVLHRLLILPIEEGAIGEVENSDIFKLELRKILKQVIVRSPELMPLQYRLEATVRFESKKDETAIIIPKRGFVVEISQSIVKKVIGKSCEIRNTPYGSSASLSEYNIVHTPEVRVEKAAELVIETLNDYLQGSNANFVITLDPGTYELYWANKDILYKIIKQNADSKGFYKMKEISGEIPLRLSQFSLFNLVSECLRLKGTIARKDLMNWRNFEESSEQPQ